MLLQDCYVGLRVAHKATGRVGTVKEADLNKGDVLVAFDNGSTSKLSPRYLELWDKPDSPPTPSSGPSRPCPQCAARIPLDSTVCSFCGFEYGPKTAGSWLRFFEILVMVAVVAGIAFLVWKFMLNPTPP